MAKKDDQKGIFKDEETQQMLNSPLKDTTPMDETEKIFLELVIKLIVEGKINLYDPDSVINFDHYDGLTDAEKGKVDMEALNLLSALREMKDLHDAGYADTFQMNYLVNRIRLSKERLEEEGGDMFII